MVSHKLGYVAVDSSDWEMVNVGIIIISQTLKLDIRVKGIKQLTMVKFSILNCKSDFTMLTTS
jgi:hypothetical protein